MKEYACWPDQTICEVNEIENFMFETGRSDDYIIKDDQEFKDFCPECEEYSRFYTENLGWVCPECDDLSCSFCAGTGEGQFDGSRCPQCKGSGKIDLITKMY